VAQEKQRFNLWLETESRLMVMDFANDSIVPWSLSNRWINCKKLMLRMNFVVSHICR